MTANTNVLEVGDASLPPALAPKHVAAKVIELPRREVVRIRNYTSEDKESIRRLCCDTGYFGNPVDELFQDRELFADLFTKAYLDHEPEWGFVAEVNGRVVGYLLGSVDPNFDWLLMRSGFKTTMKMLFRLFTGKYSKHPRSRRFIRWLLFSGYGEQPKHPRDAAHLHCDIDEKFRGRGIGPKLFEQFVARAKSAGVKICYGAFFSYPERRPEVAYSRFGFEVYDRRRTTMFEPEVKDPVEVVCCVKTL
jgi:ribosomal protein S18 acetylase RimI-like enzyme